jgi:CRISPR/Cas system-associated protein Csm6
MTPEQLAELRRIELEARRARWAAERDHKDAEIALMSAEMEMGLRADDERFKLELSRVTRLREVFSAYAEGDDARGMRIIMGRRAA